MSDETAKRAVTKMHFELLKNFGRSALQRDLSDKDKETLWKMSCQTAKLVYVPLETTIEVWKEFIGGESTRSHIAISGEIDPNYTTIGVTFDRALVATHTTTSRAILRKVLQIWRRSFGSEDEYMEAVRKLALSAVRVEAKKKGSSR